MAGVAALFTREFFEAVRDRLAPGGIVCQWAHTYDISDADLRSIVATFASVFPDGTMWLVGDSDVLFVATNDAGGPRLENIARGWSRPGVAEDLAVVSVADVFSLLSLYIGGPGELRRYGAGAVVQTDDRMSLEFSGPVGLYQRHSNSNLSTLRALLNPAQAPAAVRAETTAAGAVEWRHLGQMLAGAHAYSAAFAAFSQSVRLDSNSEAGITGLVDAAGSADLTDEAQRLLEALTRAQPRDTHATSGAGAVAGGDRRLRGCRQPCRGSDGGGARQSARRRVARLDCRRRRRPRSTASAGLPHAADTAGSRGHVVLRCCCQLSRWQPRSGGRTGGSSPQVERPSCACLQLDRLGTRATRSSRRRPPRVSSGARASPARGVGLLEPGSAGTGVGMPSRRLPTSPSR